LDLAQVEESDSVWIQNQELAQVQAQVQVQESDLVGVQATVQALAQARAGQVQQAHSVQDLMEQLQQGEQAEVRDLVQVEAEARESALPKGYRLDSEQGLVRDLVQVTELELG
jgi:hypothetical protein